MPIRLIRWALPHRGPPTHLSSLEYALRLIVFMPLWLVTLLPAVAFLLFIGCNGVFALAVVVGFGGILDHGLRLTDAQKAELTFYAISFVTVAAINLFIRYRYLTPR